MRSFFTGMIGSLLTLVIVALIAPQYSDYTDQVISSGVLNSVLPKQQDIEVPIKQYDYWNRETNSISFTDKKSTEPTKHEIINEMLQYPEKLSNHLATVMTNCAESGKANVKIDVGFEPPLYSELDKIIVWHVWVALQCNESENEIFYTCGVDFFMRDDSRKAIAKSFRNYGPC